MPLSEADRASLQRVVVVTNEKGGVGKTSVVANLSGLLAEAGWRVLAIDLDPQGNLGKDLGYDQAGNSDAGKGLYRSVALGDPLTPLKDVRPRLDVVCGGAEVHDLAALLDSKRLQASSGASIANLLAISLAPIAADYDLILIDTPPNQRALQEIALGAARWVLIPTKSDSASTEGLVGVADRFTTVIEANPTLELLGVVIFAITSNATRVLQEARADIINGFGSDEFLFDEAVRHAEGVASPARRAGLLVHEMEKLTTTAPAWWETLRAAQEARAQGREPAIAKRTPSAASAENLASDWQRLAEAVVDRLLDNESAAGEPASESTDVRDHEESPR